MLFPKFTIRMMLILMIGVGVISACMAGASRGSSVAFGLATSMIATVIPFLMLALTYWLGVGVAKTWGEFGSASVEDASLSTRAGTPASQSSSSGEIETTASEGRSDD
jgi:hypothetical protein